MSSCSFTLGITMQAETRIATAVQMPLLCVCKNYRGMVMQDGKKCLCIISQLTRRSCVKKKKGVVVVGGAYSTSSKFLLVARHAVTMGL